MTRAVVAVGFLALVGPLTAHADPFAIQVLSATCSTTVALTSVMMPEINQTATTTGCQSSQSLAVGDYWDEIDGPVVRASASADYFATSVDSSAYYGARVSDSADSLLMFVPLTDGTALLGIDYFQMFYNTMSIALFDMTSQQMVWEQQWARGGFVSGTLGSLPPIGSVVVPTAFSAAHEYALHLYTDGNSNNDGTQASLQVTGLVKVPEPSTLLSLVTGLAGIGVFRRARTRKLS